MNTAARPLEWEEEFLAVLAKMDSAIIHEKNPQRKNKMVLYHTIICCGGWMGLRAKELLSLRWDDVLKSKSTEIYQYKTKKKRKVYLSEIFQQYVQLNYKRANPLNVKHMILHRQHDPTQPISTNQFNGELKKYFKRFGLEMQYLSTHTLRKTYMEKLWQTLGGDEKAYITLAKNLGYSDRSQVMDYLCHSERDIKNAVLKF